MRERKNRVDLYLTDSQWEILERICLQRGAARAAVLRAMIEEHAGGELPLEEYNRRLEEVAEELRRIGRSMDKIALQAAGTGWIDDGSYRTEAENLRSVYARLLAVRNRET